MIFEQKLELLGYVSENANDAKMYALSDSIQKPARVAVWVKLHGYSGLRSRVREFESPSFSSSLWLQ